MAPKQDKKAVKPAGAKKQKAPRMITKDVGGDKNGSTRTVRSQRLVRYIRCSS